MPSREVEGRCVVCGAPAHREHAGRGVRCADCFATYLRGIDAAFLDNLSRFGIRGHRLVAETCLRALVLANADDRKLLGMTIYEQFVLSASALVALHRALRLRHAKPIAESYLTFQHDAVAARAFFAELGVHGPAGMLAAVGLPSPAALPAIPGMGRKERRDLDRSLQEAVSDLERLSAIQDLGERALAMATSHLRGGLALADRTQWLAGRAISPNQVASIALDSNAGRLDVAAVRVDEERLEQVVDGIDVFTRLARNLIHAFLTLHDGRELAAGYQQSRPRSGTEG